MVFLSAEPPDQPLELYGDRLSAKPQKLYPAWRAIRPLESLLGGELPPPLRKLETEEGGSEEIIELTLPEQFPDILEDCSRRLDDLLWQNTPETRERYEDSLKLFCIAFRVSLLARKNAVLAIEDGSERTRARL